MNAQKPSGKKKPAFTWKHVPLVLLMLRCSFGLALRIVVIHSPVPFLEDSLYFLILIAYTCWSVRSRRNRLFTLLYTLCLSLFFAVLLRMLRKEDPGSAVLIWLGLFAVITYIVVVHVRGSKTPDRSNASAPGSMPLQTQQAASRAAVKPQLSQPPVSPLGSSAAASIPGPARPTPSGTFWQRAASPKPAAATDPRKELYRDLIGCLKGVLDQKRQFQLLAKRLLDQNGIARGEALTHLAGQRQLFSLLVTVFPSLNEPEPLAQKLFDLSLQDDPSQFLPALDEAVSNCTQRLTAVDPAMQELWLGQLGPFELLCGWHALNCLGRMSDFDEVYRLAVLRLERRIPLEALRKLLNESHQEAADD